MKASILGLDNFASNEPNELQSGQLTENLELSGNLKALYKSQGILLKWKKAVKSQGTLVM